MKSIIVLYHDDQDGFGGAWTAWKKFKNKAEYFPVNHGGKSAPKIKNKEIYLIDFCYPRKIMEELLANNKKLIVIDHHISRKEETKISTDRLYGVKNSGAVFAWKYFYQKKPIPKLLLYIENMDLYKFKLPYAKEIAASLELYDFNFKLWDKIAADFENPKKFKKYIEEGEAILKYQKKLIKYLLGGGNEAYFEDKKAFVVNSPILESEIGEAIYKDKKMVGIIYCHKNREINVSLRSNKIDVAKLAEKYGGGGHKYASGFTFNPKAKFPWGKAK